MSKKIEYQKIIELQEKLTKSQSSFIEDVYGQHLKDQELIKFKDEIIKLQREMIEDLEKRNQKIIDTNKQKDEELLSIISKNNLSEHKNRIKKIEKDYLKRIVK